MGGGGNKETTQTQQQQTQQTKTDPWAPAQPLLQQILGNLGGQSTAVTPEQQAALAKWQTGAGAIPGFGTEATGAVQKLFGTSTEPQRGLLSEAYGKYRQTLDPYSSPDYLDPYKTPGFSDALKTAGGDITKRIQSQFAAAGRDFSPDYVQTLSRGLGQAYAPTIANQYNANVAAQQGAAGAEFGAGGQTAGGEAGLLQQEQEGWIRGLQASGLLPQLYTAPGQAAYEAAGASYGQPYQNIYQQLQGVLPIAGLGGSSFGTGTGTSTQTKETPWLNTIIGAAGLGLGAYGALKPSDVRFKENIEPVGILTNGLPVYRYSYRGDPTRTPEIGLLAQEVELLRPDAVAEDERGLKYVDYDRATKAA
jgi:hypothetical protein